MWTREEIDFINENQKAFNLAQETDNFEPLLTALGKNHHFDEVYGPKLLFLVGYLCDSDKVKLEVSFKRENEGMVTILSLKTPSHVIEIGDVFCDLEDPYDYIIRTMISEIRSHKSNEEKLGGMITDVMEHFLLDYDIFKKNK